MIDAKDNVATAIADLWKGRRVQIETLAGQTSLVAAGDIPFGHKLALVDIGEGENIVKYGSTVGRATKDIGKGTHVHTHNVESARGRGDMEAKTR